VCGTYYYYARARVINPNFTNCVCQSTNLTRVTFVLLPPAPTNPQGATNCALNGAFGECSNPSMSVSVLTNFDNPAGVLSANWYDASGSSKTNGSLSYVPTNAAAGFYKYFVEATNPATGFVSPTRTEVDFKLNALPYAPTNAVGATNVLTSPYQTNALFGLSVNVNNSTNLIATDSPGATVTVDWYVSDINQLSYSDAQAGGYGAVGGAANYDGASGWAAGNNLLVATNTLVFYPTNRVCGTYYYYARARVINPNFTNCVCQSTNLTRVTFVLLPPAPTNTTPATANYCASNPGSWTNSVMVLVNSDNPPGQLTANWYDAKVGGSLLAANSTNYVPTNTIPGNYTNWVESQDLASGLISTNRTPVAFMVDTNPTISFYTIPNIHGTNDFAQHITQSNYPKVTVNVDGSFNVNTYFGTNSSIVLSNTVHLQLTGSKLWTVIWAQVGADQTGLNSLTNYSTNTYSTSNSNIVFSNTIYKSAANTNFTISVAWFNDTNNCLGSTTNNPITIYVNASPTLDVNALGYPNNQGLLCSDGITNDDQVTNVVDLLSAYTNTWTVTWNDGVSITTNSPKNSIVRIFTIPTNSIGQTQYVTNYWVTRLVCYTNTNQQITNSFTETDAANDGNLVTITVDPQPSGPPTVYQSFVTNCYYTPVTFSVGVSNGFTADWYVYDGSDTINITNIIGSTNYTPMVPYNLGANNFVTNIYWVAARYNDTNLNGCESSTYAYITNVWYECGNLVINSHASGPGNIVLQWNGTNVLQSATNLSPPINWMNVSTGSTAQVNSWTTNATSPPNQFFRLYAPTN